jgi:serine/threonine protein kinase
MNPNGAQSTDRDEQLGRVLAEWLEFAEQGQPPDETEYLGRYPEFRAELAQCIADWKRFPRPHGSAERLPENGTLGDFRILREVGRGGMGVVYEAEQISLGRRVALKVLPFAATMDSRHLQRFQNEARAAASLEHPHIVPVYGVGCERGVHYYAMKFIDGQSLAEVIDEVRKAKESQHRGTENTEKKQNTAMSSLCSLCLCGSTDFYKSVAELGIQAAEALEHAHCLGIVHRDIKPANLMIDGNGSLWVTDFGLARTAADAGLTMTGDVLGTLRYMSTEQALAKHGLVDHRTDVYSLGVTLYELLTGKPAVEGKDREEILNAITLEEPLPPRRLNSVIPQDLETIVLKALEKNPGERYATAKQFADDLRRYLGHEAIQARRPTTIQRLRKWGTRHRSLVASGVLCLFLVTVVLTVASVLIWRKQQETDAAYQTAKEQRQHAIDSLKDARAAVEQMLTRVGEQKLVDVPQMEGVRRELLEDALKFCAKFLDQSPSDPELQFETARVSRLAGVIELRLGRHAQAASRFQDAVRLLRLLIKENGAGSDYQEELARNNVNLGYARIYQGQAQDAEAAYQESAALPIELKGQVISCLRLLT